MAGRRLYRRLLVVFPANLRARHGDDMAQLFADRCREARAGVSAPRGAMRVTGLWLLALRDLVVHGLLARLGLGEGRRSPRGPGRPGGGAHRSGDGRRESFAATVVHDLYHAARGLVAAPGFTAVALVSLALGIGAATAIFTLVNALLLRPLPVADPGQLVQVTTRDTGIETPSLTNPQWESLRDRENVFEGVFATGYARLEVAGDDGAGALEAAWVSGAYFSALGLAPAAGRLIDAADDYRGCPAIAVLGHGYWQRRYGADPEIVGRTLPLSGIDFEIVGVVQPGFTGLTVESVTDVYAPLCADAVVRGERSPLDRRRTWWLRVIGRRPEGVSLDAVRAELAALAPAVLNDSVPTTYGPAEQAEYLGGTLEARPASTGFSRLRGEYRHSLMVLLAAVGVVVLAVCGNLANLLLARAARRRREIALRVALGAGRLRLLRQLLSESLLLAALGALAGVAVAYAASRTLVALISPAGTTLSLDLSPDLRVLGFTTALTIVTAALFGLGPAWRSLRTDPHAAMGGGRGALGGPPSLLAGGALVAFQVTLSLVLLTGAGLLAGTLWRLETLDPGFDRQAVVLVDADIGDAGFGAEQRGRIFVDLLEQLRALDGVRAATFAEMTPLSGNSIRELIVPEGFESLLDDDAEVFVHRVGDGYFAAMGTAMLRGRDFRATDVREAEPVAVLSESAARRTFGSLDVVGRTIHRRLTETEVGAPIRVVGVVRDAKYLSLRDGLVPTVYFALRQQTWFSWPDTLTFHVLAEENAAGLTATIRSTVEQSAAGARAETTLLSEHLSASLSRERLLATISVTFGSLALFLAVIGLYGVMSFNVARRLGEIGVRLALGSSERGLFALVLAQSARPVLLGLVVGGFASLAAARSVASLLYDLDPYDPRVFAFSATILAVAALLSAAIPARRAAHLDPAQVLRQDSG